MAYLSPMINTQTNSSTFYLLFEDSTSGPMIPRTDSNLTYIPTADLLGVGGITVTNNSLVANLNADMLDGQHSSYFAISTHNHNETYAPVSHVHGNITNAGAIGTTADLIVKTTTSGVLTTLAAGTSGQFLAYNGTWATPPDNNTTYTAGNGLGLSGTTFSLDTPGTLTASTSNGVTADSHTHAITTSSSGAVSTIIATDAGGNISIGNVTAASLKKSGGTSLQFLKADGSVDSNTYSTTSHNHSDVYQPVDADLTAIAALSGTSGFLKKTAADTWILESIPGSTTTYSGTLSTSWSGSQAPFSQAVTVMGIASTDEPILDVVMSGTYATDKLRNTEWAYIYYAVTATDQITFYARQKPTASLPFTAKVI